MPLSQVQDDLIVFLEERRRMESSSKEMFKALAESNAEIGVIFETNQLTGDLG